MTLKIKNSDEWDGDSRMASYSSFDGNSHADQTRLMVDEQEQDQLVPNGGETEEMLDGQTAMVRIHENELKRRNSLHVTSHAGVVLRRKPKASSRPRYIDQYYWLLGTLMFDTAFCCSGCLSVLTSLRLACLDLVFLPRSCHQSLKKAMMKSKGLSCSFELET
jgi:hypothetical protein